MRTLISRVIIVLLWCAMWPPASPADEIILNSGERFNSDKVWRENGKIRFNMHGLIVSVNPEDVAAINRSTPVASAQTAAKKTTPEPPTPSSPLIALNPPLQETPKPIPQTVQATKAPSKSHLPAPRVKGIGIDGIEWQMRPTEIPGIEKVKTDPAYGGVDQYARSQGSLRMGDAMLDGLVFSFWQNRLYTITIWVDGKPGYERLRSAVFDRYGKGRQNKSGLERYIWLEDNTDRMLEFDEKLNTGILWMRSRELDQYVKQRYPD